MAYEQVKLFSTASLFVRGRNVLCSPI